MNEVVSHKLNEIEKTEYGMTYQVEVEIPMSIGWIDYIDLILETSN